MMSANEYPEPRLTISTVAMEFAVVLIVAIATASSPSPLTRSLGAISNTEDVSGNVVNAGLIKTLLSLPVTIYSEIVLA